MTNIVEMTRTKGRATKISVDRLGGLTKFETTPGGGGITGVVFRSIPALAIVVVIDVMSIDVVGPYVSLMDVRFFESGPSCWKFGDAFKVINLGASHGSHGSQ